MTEIVNAHLIEFRKHLATIKSLSTDRTDKNGITPNADRSINSYTKHAARLGGQGNSSVLHNRESLRALVVSTNDDSLEFVCAAILAWGGMSATSFDALFDAPEKQRWLGIARRIKSEGLQRGQAFKEFSDLRAEKIKGSRKSMLPGMGPAYFTKLIHFLMPRDQTHPAAHILDQWAGWSINTLWNSHIVLMDETFSWKRAKANPLPPPSLIPSLRVSDVNTCAEYECFCAKVDDLISLLGDEAKSGPLCPGDLVDRTFMFEKRRKQGTWRNYVVANHKHPRFSK